MKKTSLCIVLLLVSILTASTVLFVACDNDAHLNTPTKDLSPQQQVDIAIASLSAMRDACASDKNASTATVSLASADSDYRQAIDIDDLFDMLNKNSSAFTPTDAPSRNKCWAAFSIALLVALQQYGTDCLEVDIAPTYDFSGGDSSYAQSLKEFFPTKIRFLGTKREDDKNVIYASILISMEDLGDTLTFWYDLKTYYTDNEHFGYALLRAPIVYPEYDYRSGDLYSYYDRAEPQRFLEIEAEKMEGQCNGIIQYGDTLCNKLNSFSQQDLQKMYDFLDDTHATFPQSDERQSLSSTLSVNLDDVVNMR